MASSRSRSAAVTSTTIPVRIPQTRTTNRRRESAFGLYRHIQSTSPDEHGTIGRVSGASQPPECDDRQFPGTSSDPNEAAHPARRPLQGSARMSADALAAQKATSEIPIIAPSLFDAVDLGLIGSHADPGSNVTGIVVSLEELAGKQLALAHELMLGAGKIGLFGGGIVTAVTQRRGAQSAAAALSVQIVNAEVQSPADFDNAFQLLAREGVAIVLVLGDASLLSERQGVAAAECRHGCRACTPFESTSRRAADELRCEPPRKLAASRQLC